MHPSLTVSPRFNLTIFPTGVKHYLYTLCREPKSNALFVHDIQCCYYLLSVQSMTKLLFIVKETRVQTQVLGSFDLKSMSEGLFVWQR